jgi:hypothetical protein
VSAVTDVMATTHNSNATAAKDTMSDREGQKPMGVQCTRPEIALGGLLDAAMQIGAARREILHKMRAAFEQGNEAEALKLARQLCGLGEHEQASNRVNPRLN